MVTRRTCWAGLIAAFTAFILHAVEYLLAFPGGYAQGFAVIPETAACAAKNGWTESAFAFQWRTYIAFLNRFAVAIAFILEAVQAEQEFLIGLAAA